MMIHVMSADTASTLSGVQEGDVQPNAVDLRLQKVFKIGSGHFAISEEGKVHRSTVQLEPNREGWFDLEPGSYEVVMENQVTIGPDEAGWVITRSTLNRNGIFLTSGLYDSGYGIDVATGLHVGGVMAACMHVNAGPARIKRGTRIGQFILVKSQSLGLYNGSYGNHKQHDTKYKG